MQLVRPALPYLASYTDALERGWSPDNLRPEAARDELERITHDPTRFLAEQLDREAKGPLVTLPDGSTARRLPGYRKWMWDGEFCGVIGLRWQPGTVALPPHVLGHIGFAVVPWKRRKGYATRALALMLPVARGVGLRRLQIICDQDNEPSRRVILANGGILTGMRPQPDAEPELVFCIDL